MEGSEVKPFTAKQLASACMSYRHDFGLLPPEQQTALMLEAAEWERAFRKEFALASSPSVEVPTATPLLDALERAREAIPEFRQQDDYLLAHGASLMSEDSHEIIHIDTLTKIVLAALASSPLLERGEGKDSAGVSVDAAPVWFMRLREPGNTWGRWAECDPATVDDLRKNAAPYLYEVRQFTPAAGVMACDGGQPK